MLIPIRWWAFIHSTYCLATILVFLQCFKALAFTATSTLNPTGVMGPVDAQVDGSLKAIQSVAKPDRKVTCLGCWRWFGFWRGWSSLSSASTLTYSTALENITSSSNKISKLGPSDKEYLQLSQFHRFPSWLLCTHSLPSFYPMNSSQASSPVRFLCHNQLPAQHDLFHDCCYKSWKLVGSYKFSWLKKAFFGC